MLNFRHTLNVPKICRAMEGVTLAITKAKCIAQKDGQMMNQRRTQIDVRFPCVSPNADRMDFAQAPTFVPVKLDGKYLSIFH